MKLAISRVDIEDPWPALKLITTRSTGFDHIDEVDND